MRARPAQGNGQQPLHPRARVPDTEAGAIAHVGSSLPSSALEAEARNSNARAFVRCRRQQSAARRARARGARPHMGMMARGSPHSSAACFTGPVR